MYSTLQPCSSTCCCLRPHCISVQFGTVLLYPMLLPQASLCRCTAQYSTAVPHSAASGPIISMCSAVEHCCTTCCCLRPRCISVKHGRALMYHMLLPRATVLHCSTTCCCLRLRCIYVQYSITVQHAMLLPQTLSHQCRVHYSAAVPHGAASGLVVSVYSTVEHCCTTCCCLRLRYINV